MPVSVKCPTCQTTVEWNTQAKYKPFCSERCKLIDLGDWASEKHAIPVKPELDIQGLDAVELSDIGYDEPGFFKESK
ncbi:MAG: DNA gyrase inhibitor YacG [Parashewanella sp.]